MNKKRIGTSIICLILLIVSIFALSACGGKVKNFNLSFKVDREVYETLVTDGETSVAIPENPSKEGYIFDGWYWDESVWEKPFTANSVLKRLVCGKVITRTTVRMPSSCGDINSRRLMHIPLQSGQE